MALPTTGLTGHFDASDLSTLFKTFVSGGPHTGTPADGDTVAVWKNTAAANSIAKQIGASALPVYRAATPLLPRPCLDFQGTAVQRMGTATDSGAALPLSTFVTAAAHTVLIAFWAESITAALSSSFYVGEALVADALGYWGAFLYVLSGAPQVSAYNYDGTQDYATLPVTAGAPHVLMLRHESGTLYVSLDGGAETSTASGNTSVLTNQVQLGKGNGPVGFDGRLGEIAIYNTALTGTPLTDAVAYFTSRWLAAPAAADGRVTQAVVETLSLPTPAARVTQAVAEVISHPTPAARVTQAVIETLTSTTLVAPVTGRVTQLVVETLTRVAPQPVSVRATQLAAEVFTATPAATRATQLVAELWTPRPSPLRATQLAVELWTPLVAPARVTQALLEVFAAQPATTRVTQAIVELFVNLPPPCQSVDFPVDLLPPDGSGGGGGSSPPTVFIPKGSIMVGGFGDADQCAYLSPDGATRYAQPPAVPNPGQGTSAMCRTSDGHIGVIGGNAPTFPTTGSGLFRACDLSRLSENTNSERTGPNCIAADALGAWYTLTINGGPLFFTRWDAASQLVASWDIPIPTGYGIFPPLWAMAVSPDGQTAYVFLQRILFFPDPPDNGTYLHRFSLTGAGTWLGQITPDYNYFSVGYGSLLVVPDGSGDVIAAFENLNNTGVGAIRRYTPSGAVVWTAGTPAGAGPLTWESLAAGLPGSTHFLAWAYDDDVTTSSGARYCWFSYATGLPDNSRNFTPDDGNGFEFDSQFAVLAHDVLDIGCPDSGPGGPPPSGACAVPSPPPLAGETAPPGGSCPVPIFP